MGQKQRPMPPALRSELATHMRQLQHDGVVTDKVQPRMLSNCLAVPKPDSSNRWVADLREVNRHTVPQAYPLPSTRQALEILRGYNTYLQLDVASAYTLVPLTKETQALFGVYVGDEAFCYRRLPFGAAQSGAIWGHRLRTEILRELSTQLSISAYVDDLASGAKGHDELCDKLRRILQRFREHRFRLRLSKAHLGAPRLSFLRFIVDGDGVRPDPSRTDAIRSMPAPTSRTEARAFLGCVQQLRNWLPELSVLAAPISALTSTKMPFEWTPEAQDAFERIKQAIVDAPLLYHLDYDKPIHIYCDASQRGTGASIMQFIDGAFRPAAFHSRAFTPTQARWSTSHQECFALADAIRAFRPLIQGHHVIVHTDHQALVSLHRSEVPKLQRYALAIADQPMTVIHVPGHLNGTSDCCSRLVVSAVSSVPSEYAVIERFHSDLAGHGGVNSTLSAMRAAGVSMPDIAKHVRGFVRGCPQCQRCTAKAPRREYRSHTIAVNEPFAELAIDHVGPLPPTPDGYRYVLTAQDSFTRFVELIPVKSTNAAETAHALLQIFGGYGSFSAIRSDRGSAFTSGLCREFVAALGASQTFTPPFSPQSNGALESRHRTIFAHVRMLCQHPSMGDRWDLMLPIAMRIANATRHTGIDAAPMTLLFGAALSPHRGILSPPAPVSEGGERVPVDAYIAKLRATQEQLVAASLDYQQKRVDARLQSSPEDSHTFRVGDLVLIRPGSEPRKLDARWRGPYRIQDIKSVLHTCRNEATGHVVVARPERMKPWVQRPDVDYLAIAASDKDWFVVDRISAHKKLVPRDSEGRPTNRRPTWHFRTHWSGYDDPTWEPHAHVKLTEAFLDYVEAHPHLRKEL